MLPMVLLLSWSRLQHFFLILLPWYSESVLYRGGTFVIIRDPGTENSRKAKRKENKTAICEILSAGPKFWVFMLPRGYWLRCDKVYLQYRRPGFDPWVGKLLWRREWLPTQYSCLENSMDRGTWRSTVHSVAKSWIQLSDYHFHTFRGLTRCRIETWNSSDLIITCEAATPNKSPNQEHIYARTVPKMPVVLDHQGYS